MAVDLARTWAGRWRCAAIGAGLLVFGGGGCSGEIVGGDSAAGEGPAAAGRRGGAGSAGSAGADEPGNVSAPPGARPENYGEEVDPYAVGFDCDEAHDPSPAPLIRLTMRQYENTLRDLLGDAAVDAVQSELSQFPIDGEAEDSFSNMDGRVSQRHIDGYFNVANALSSAVVGDAAALSALAGDCATAPALDAACLRGFVRDFGARALRRPLTAAEIDRYLELDQPGVEPNEVYRGVLFTLLMAPQFLYHFEVDGSELDGRGELLELSPYELASRLSYHFWQTMPDAELLAAAADGSLASDDGYRDQVERLYEDPRTTRSVRRFFADWFRLDIFGGFARTPAFATFSQGVRADDALYRAAVEEVEALIDYHLDNGGSFADLLESNVVVTRSSELAELYGVAPWDGGGTPDRFPAGERAGLLTRAAMLISSNHTTNPFKRGAFVRRDILCVPVRPPADLPPGALTPPPFDPTASTRERFEQKVQSPTCAGCHSSFTPFGMALEAYDGLGRFRAEERLIDDEGAELGSVPVDSQVGAQIEGAEQVELAGPVELSQALADSSLAQQCFARHYFRYTYRRAEQIGDECALDAIRKDVLPGDGSLEQALRDVALEPAFRRRVVQ